MTAHADDVAAALWVENGRLRSRVRELEAFRDKWGAELESIMREIREAVGSEADA